MSAPVRAPAKAIRFVDFCEGVCRMKLTRAQRVLVAVSFDGLEPRDLEGNDREIARKLFGDIETITPEARAILVWVIGARSGKSRLAAYFALWRALTANLTGLAPGELASALIVAPDTRLGRQTLRYALGVIRSVPDLARLVQTETKDSVELLRPDSHKVVIEVLPATSGGRATRGRAFVCAVLEETAFFRDSDSHQVNDADLFASITPRVIHGGQVLLCSTPWAREGLLYDEFNRNHGAPQTALAAHAPTAVMRDGDVRIMGMVERERIRDPENCAREYEAQFFEGGTAGLFDSDAIDDAVRLDADRERHQRTPVAAGADFAFLRDASACIVTSQSDDGIVWVECVEELRPARGAPLLPSVVCQTFARACDQFGIGALMSDAHGKASIIEHLSEHGIEYVDGPATQKAIADSYLVVRDLLNQGRLALPNHKRLIKQLREATLVVSAGGGLSVRHPRTAGSHGDLCAALVLAVAQAHAGSVGEGGIVGGHRRYTRRASDDRTWNGEGGSRSGSCDLPEDYCDENDD